jgi:hypothetical protein
MALARAAALVAGLAARQAAPALQVGDTAALARSCVDPWPAACCTRPYSAASSLPADPWICSSCGEQGRSRAGALAPSSMGWLLLVPTCMWAPLHLPRLLLLPPPPLIAHNLRSLMAGVTLCAAAPAA